jgi:hypothetical protein
MPSVFDFWNREERNRKHELVSSWLLEPKKCSFRDFSFSDAGMPFLLSFFWNAERRKIGGGVYIMNTMHGFHFRFGRSDRRWWEDGRRKEAENRALYSTALAYSKHSLSFCTSLRRHWPVILIMRAGVADILAVFFSCRHEVSWYQFLLNPIRAGSFLIRVAIGVDPNKHTSRSFFFLE